MFDWFWRFFDNDLALVPLPPELTAIATIAAINAERQREGKPILIQFSALDVIAQDWANKMARRNRQGHDNFKQRLRNFSFAAENVSYGQNTVARVVLGWMGSPLHRANMMGNYSIAGVGIARNERGVTYWCLNLTRT